jgi:hypothetical protein
LSIRKLTYNNPTMKAKFDSLKDKEWQICKKVFIFNKVQL